MPETRPTYPHVLHRRTWYGVTASVEISSKWIHRAGFGKLLVPHPGLANWLLRRGMNPKVAATQCIRHEFWHLQTVPFAAVYTGILLAVSIGAETMSWLKLLVLAVSAQAVWEFMSEFFTRFSDIETYRAGYKGIRKLPRIVFWLTSVVAAGIGTFIFVY
ncbi:MAG: hypothetical protein WAM61_21975 [Desulfobacterales bacterium]